MQIRKALGSSLIALALTACVSAGNHFEWATVRQVEEGMSAAELEALMGKPSRIATQGADEVWVWAWAGSGWNLSSKNKTVSFVLRDGVVVQVPNLPESFK